MGLDTTHNCWHGSYGEFMRWRNAVAIAAGIPPIEQMVGFGGYIPWSSLLPSPLHLLLNHSDCDGELLWQHCAAIADALEAVIPKMADDAYSQDLARQFVEGLRAAAEAEENVMFH